MVLNISLQPDLALIAGILILVFIRLLNNVVAIYLIIVGIAGLARQVMGADKKASAQKQLDKLKEGQDAAGKIDELKSAIGEAWEDLKKGIKKTME